MKMKRTLSVILCLVLAFTFTACTSENAQTNATETTAETTQEETTSKPYELPSIPAKNSVEIPINFESAILYCVETNEILYEHNSKVQCAPASIAKLLTAVVALENVSSTECFTVGSEQELLHEHSSLCLISKGHKLTLYDLITGMLMASGNDAAYTIAVNVARKVNSNEDMTDTEAVKAFKKMMNECKNKIGMKDSHFSNPDGWDGEKNYTTVYDLMLLSKYALEISEIREIVGTFSKRVVFKSGENITWQNTNKLLNPESEFYIPEAIGMKTGTTKSAMNSLSTAFVINQNTYIAVIVGCSADNDRYTAAKNLYSIAKGTITTSSTSTTSTVPDTTNIGE